MTMEFIDGVKINDLAGLKTLGMDPRELSSIVCEVFSAMIFSHGFVHCDPHPGNLLARRSPDGSGAVQLVLLDHGERASHLLRSLLTVNADV